MKCNHKRPGTFGTQSFKWEKHLLVPVGEGHHDVQGRQTEVEVEEGVVISDTILLIVYSSAYTILSHHSIST